MTLALARAIDRVLEVARRCPYLLPPELQDALRELRGARDAGLQAACEETRTIEAADPRAEPEEITRRVRRTFHKPEDER